TPIRDWRVSILVFSSENKLAALMQVIMMISFISNRYSGLMRVMKICGPQFSCWRQLGCCRGLPLNQLQVQHKDGIDHRDKQQRHKRRDTKTTDLGVAERFPEGSPVNGQGYEPKHSRADRDHHGPQSHYAGIEQSFSQRLPSLVRFFDEVEENDDVTDDHAHQACDSQEPHKSEGLAHDHEAREGSCHPVGDGSEHEKRLDRTSELHNQCNVDQHYGNRHDHAEFLKTFLLFVVFASDLEEIAGRQVLLELLDFRQQGREHLRRQHARNRERGYRNRPELIAALYLRYRNFRGDV